MKVVILASGPSLNDEDIEYVKRLRLIRDIGCVIAVSDVGLLKTPWADALCSHDTSWWVKKEAREKFKNRKFSGRKDGDDIEGFDIRALGIPGGMNSGLFAMYVARDVFKATEIYLLGFDMHRRNGQHFFGDHPEGMINTDERRFKIHIKQFDYFKGCEVYNCTEGSDLKHFPFAKLRDKL